MEEILAELEEAKRNMKKLNRKGKQMEILYGLR